MLGRKDKNFKTHTAVSLDDLVPDNNFYRQVEECLNLHFVRDLVHGLYSPIGRPSIDPVVFFKLQLIAFFEGIRSERQLMESVNLNLARSLEELGEPERAALAEAQMAKFAYGLEPLQEMIARQPDYPHLQQTRADLDDIARRLEQNKTAPN